MKGDPLPPFPDFQSLNEVKKEAIEIYTSQYLPYAAFSYVNIHAWNVHNKRHVCDLNGNLLLLNVSYETQEPFLSMLGQNNLLNSVRQMQRFLKDCNISCILRAIPGETARELSKLGFHTEEDRDSFEYVFSTESLSKNEGGRFKKKRKHARKFEKMYPDVRFEIGDISDRNIHSHIFNAMNRWEERKIEEEKEYEIATELEALTRFLDSDQDKNIILSCLYYKDTMIGFSIDEVLSNKYSIAHFVKADTAYMGIYEFFNEQIAKVLFENGIEYWNWQQDLGIDGLRQLKKSYHPVQFLKKFTVNLDYVCEPADFLEIEFTTQPKKHGKTDIIVLVQD